MPLGRTIHTVNVAGKPRVLFSILEKPNGELIVPFRLLERRGANYMTGTPILEQRFSIHPSLKSAEFTTVKHTTNLADGKRIVHTALTDAVKGKTGFFMIFARRAPIMSADKYLLSERDRNRSTIVDLPEYNQATHTLFYSLFVGPNEIEFRGPENREVIVKQYSLKRFRIVFVAGLLSLPSVHSSEFMHILTMDPSLSSDTSEQEVWRGRMRGSPDHICLLKFKNAGFRLAKRFLEYVLSTGEVADPEIIALIDLRVAEYQRLILPLEVDIGPQLARTQTDAKPPSPR